MIPMSRLLTEGVEDGEFEISDIPTAMTFMQTAIWQMAMVRLLEDGSLDASELTRATMPLLLGALGGAA